MTTEETKFQPKDYKSDQYVRWCPGCGDHAVLNCLHKAMAEVGVAPHNMAVISGIGCSSRFPYYISYFTVCYTQKANTKRLSKRNRSFVTIPK